MSVPAVTLTRAIGDESLMAKSKLTLLDRFMQFVLPEPMSGCWLWTGSCCSGGYGTFRVGGRKGNTVACHRFSYEEHRGPIPTGLDLDHLCRVRCCVNPWHLEPVTNAENTRRGLAGINMRSKTHCPKGHPYSEGNTYLSKTNRRHCKTCLAIRDLETRPSRKEYFAARHRSIKTAKHLKR